MILFSWLSLVRLSHHSDNIFYYIQENAVIVVKTHPMSLFVVVLQLPGRTPSRPFTLPPYSSNYSFASSLSLLMFCPFFCSLISFSPPSPLCRALRPSIWQPKPWRSSPGGSTPSIWCGFRGTKNPRPSLMSLSRWASSALHAHNDFNVAPRVANNVCSRLFF